MITTLRILCAAAFAAGVASAAPEAVKRQQSASVSTRNNKQGKPAATAITGSYIKREVRQAGQITNGPYQVVVYDSESIRRSGASDLADFLKRRDAGR